MNATAGCTLAVVLMSGCLMTTDQGDKLRDDISQLSKRMEAIETRINDQMARLRKVLDEATGLLERNSADLGTKVARNESDIAALTGKLEEAKYLLDELQKQATAGSDGTNPAEDDAGTAEDHRAGGPVHARGQGSSLEGIAEPAGRRHARGGPPLSASLHPALPQ
jgi:septal ring factor EnvC (AmiA/AmiB activator)